MSIELIVLIPLGILGVGGLAALTTTMIVGSIRERHRLAAIRAEVDAIKHRPAR